jgi:hypothetical protein
MGVGLLQARALRGVVDRPARWVWACAGGVALPFLVTDVAPVVGATVPYSLYACVAAGGLLAGAWQMRLLRPLFRSTGWWMAASAAGWSLAGGTVVIADALQRRSAMPRGIWGALAYLAIISAGGVVLGVVTAVPFGWMAPRSILSTPADRPRSKSSARS